MTRSILKSIALATLAAASPAAAQIEKSPEWWLVLDQRDSQAAHFVDLASVDRSGQEFQVKALILDRSGQRQVRVLNVVCRSSGGDPTITNFVCGSEEYRSENGVILGMVSPDEMAHILFAAQSGTS